MSRDIERRYRRWLLTYPRGYRRVRGDELVATLTASAPDGPTARVALNLIRHGLRARLGRPGSRSVVFWSIVNATIVGLFAASVASWAAWLTSPGPVDGREAATIVEEVLPGYDFEPFYVPKSLFTIYTHPLAMSNIDMLFTIDAGEYSLDSTHTSVASRPVTEEATTAVQLRLEEAGWSVRPAAVVATACGRGACVPSPSTEISAYRGDVALSLVFDMGESGIFVEMRRTAPPLVLPAAIVAGLIGSVLAWIAFGWASRRTSGPSAVATTVLSVVTMMLWWAPVVLVLVVAAFALLLTGELRDAGPADPLLLWEWLGQPAMLIPFLLGCATALVALIVAALARPQPSLENVAEEH